MDKTKSPIPKPAPSPGAKPAAAPAKAPAPAPAPHHPPPLFRPIDWLTFAVTTVLVMVGYLYTLAPDLTLEDSGELATGSFYAGIPHPPGYPVWTMYTWLWTVILPFKNVAWRVAVGSAFAGAVASGLLGFLVSRGSSMMMEGIADLKAIDRRLENAICVVAGFVSGMLLGFNGYLWSQSVIVEVYSFSVLSLMAVLLCLLRWIYAPHQRRYLYWAWFLFGISFTNHQSLIVAAMGIVAAIAATDFRLGRSMFAWIIVAHVVGYVLKQQGIIFRDTNAMIFIIFNVVGLAGFVCFIWFAIMTDEGAEELIRDFLKIVGFSLLVIGFVGPTKFLILPGAAALAGFVYFAWLTWKKDHAWLVGMICGFLLLLGGAFFLYMPLAGMSTPPMQWGYPRTVEGFIHAFTRGQYEKTNPTNLLTWEGWVKYVGQIGMLFEGIVDEFNWVYALIALVPFLFFLRMQKRERAWVIGISSIYICLGFLLLLLISPPPDRQARELIRVFFTASHVMIAMGVGYGLTLIAAETSTRLEQVRPYLIFGAIAAVDFAAFTLVSNAHSMLADFKALEAAQTFGYLKILFWILAVIGAWVMIASGQEDNKLAALGVPGLFVAASFGVTFAAIMKDKPSTAGFAEMAHAFSQSFKPDQYAIPMFAGMLLLGITVAILAVVGLKAIRSPLTIVLCLFAVMPVYTFLTHWSDNEQRGHLFGYWFGHDMFTPPFKGKDGKFGHHDSKERQELMKDPEKSKFIYPEMTRDAVLYGGTDPGRFCPTYMIFCESFIPPRCKPHDPDFDRRDVYIITQNALADGTYLNYIRSHYNRSTQIDPPFFQELFRTQKQRDYDQTNLLARLAYNVLDRPFLSLGAKIEARRRAEGVYPPKEMYIATPDDSQKCFSDYLQDAQKRLQQGRLRPGEDVKIEGGRVQVQGQIAVMAINGLITKVMFDHNPTNEFFVEESFPLDWMYPHLTPFGVIMKINREKLPTLTEDILQRDHEFWSQYSERLIGNWITYDTSVKEIVDFVEKVYLRRDFSTFKGDRKFVRDDQAQKAFSKLRSSIGGIYAWRLNPDPFVCAPEFRPKTNEEYERIKREADFTFRQAFAFCPYSPEAVFRYVQLLLQFNRIDDALLVAETCQKLDPYNGQVLGLVDNLKRIKEQPHAARGNPMGSIQEAEAQWQKNPNDFQNALNLAATYMQMQQRDRGVAILDAMVNNPKVDAGAVLAVAQAYSQLQDWPKLEATLDRLTKVTPDSPEAWYDFAAMKAFLGKANEAIPALSKALDLAAKRPEANSKDRNLVSEARKDARFASIRALPEFQRLVPPQ